MHIRFFDGEQHLNFHIHLYIIVHSSIHWSYYELYLLPSALKLRNVLFRIMRDEHNKSIHLLHWLIRTFYDADDAF